MALFWLMKKFKDAISFFMAFRETKDDYDSNFNIAGVFRFIGF